jgi:O-antigen biosynthesis protein
VLTRLPFPSSVAVEASALLVHLMRSGHSASELGSRAMRLIRAGGLSELRRRIGRLADTPRAGGPTPSYDDWVARFDTLAPDDLERMKARVATLAAKPLISVVMPTYNTPAAFLEAAIRSVLAQTYPFWELCIADDASTEPHVRAVLEAFAAADPRIKLTFRATNGHISAASNSALELATGEWIALLDHDDVLRPHALFCVAEAIGRRPDAELIYSDEDKIDEGGRRFDAHFKADFLPDLFECQNYLNHLTVHRRANILAVGGWRAGFEGSQDFDLNYRIIERIDPKAVVHIPRILYHWRAIEGSTALRLGEKNYAFEAALAAARDHVRRTGVDATVEAVPGTPHHRLKFAVPSPAPPVTIIIPTRNGAAILEQCLTSLFDRTTYPSFEVIIVDNGSTEPDALALFDRWGSRPEVRVMAAPGPFNYSALNNRAVAEAGGEFVCLMNNDVEIIDPDWLSEMVATAARPGVGCVGAKLLYPNGTLQHAGVILGIGGVAGHSHKYFPGEAPGYFNRLKLPQTVSAVTAACLLVARKTYIDVGGLDEQNLAVAFNDVDFCLRVREAGFRNVWTPFARLIHHESVTRGAETTPSRRARFGREADAMKARWGDMLRTDPAYSPNLTLEREDFSLAIPPRVPTIW